MKFVLVAGDFAQSEVLEMLGDSLRESGHVTINFLAYGIHSIESIEDGLWKADVLISGMSENSAVEIAAVQLALKQGKRVALYADTYGAHRLPAFEPVRNANLELFVINVNEEKDAKRLFPNAHVHVTGNPRWEQFFTPKLSRAEARKTLNVGDDKIVILCVGDKYLAQNMLQFGTTVDAVRRLGWEGETEIIFALHPGDQHDPKLYEEIVTNSGCLTRILDRPIRSGDILSGCDFVVEFTSTIGIQAACLRIPVIDFCTTIAMKGKKIVHGESPWELAKHDASMPVYHEFEFLSDVLHGLRHDEKWRERLKKAQEKMFPSPSSPQPGGAIRRMTEVLTK